MTPNNDLDSLISQATEHKKQAERHWMDFCRLALQIRDGGQWKERAPTWAVFVRQTWDLDDSRIRQYAAALPYAERIRQANEDLSAREGTIRKLKRVVSSDDPLMLPTYRLGVEAAAVLSEAPKESHFKHAYMTLTEATTTGGWVDVGGEAPVPVGFEGNTLAAILTSMEEAQSRLKERLTTRAAPRKVKAKSAGAQGQYWLSSEDGSPLPAEFEFKIYMKGDDNGQATQEAKQKAAGNE